MKISLVIAPDLSEKLSYNIGDLPVYACREHLMESDHIALCHWHPDLEFIKIDRGAMNYFVNGETLKLKEGEGIFINSRRLHHGFSDGQMDCEFHVLIIHPDLFAKSCGCLSDYSAAKFGPNNEDYIRLSVDIPWQKEVLNGIMEMENRIEKEDPLSVLSDAVRLCAEIGNHIQCVRDGRSDNKHYQEFLLMVNYIQNHYAEKITIDDMALSGSVCRSLCCSLFQEFASQTPTQYLTRYRLLCSRQALRETRLSVTEISGQCGFQTPSYYASVFKKNFGMTPQEYRIQEKAGLL